MLPELSATEKRDSDLEEAQMRSQAKIPRWTLVIATNGNKLINRHGIQKTLYFLM